MNKSEINYDIQFLETGWISASNKNHYILQYKYL